MGVSTDVWRARIGTFHNKSRVSLNKITLQPWSSLLPAISFLLLLDFLLICAGDVELNPGPQQLKCRRCSYTSLQLLNLFQHQLIHKNDRNFRHQCPVNIDCKQEFKTFEAFKTHVYRFHHYHSTSTNPASRNSLPHGRGPRVLACPVLQCNQLFPSEEKIKEHLRKLHLKNGESVPCIVPGCEKVLKTANYFNVHLSRDHNGECRMLDVNHFHQGHEENTNNPAREETSNPGERNESLEENPEQENDLMDWVDDEDDTDWATDNEFIKAISKFYLKLVTKKEIPEDKVQSICEDFGDLLEINQKRQQEKLRHILKGMEISPENVEEAVTELSNSDVLYHTHSKSEIGYTKLNTTHLRFEHVKKNFIFISPENIPMDGLDNIGRAIQAYQVLIRDSITALINHPKIQPIIEDSFNQQPSTDGIIRSFMDGELYKISPYAGKRVIRLFGYQDAFEVCVPIGAAKLLHKMLGFYYCLANLPPCLRQKLDMILLALLVKTKDWKIPQVQSKCWNSLLKQLKELEIDGVMFKGEKIPVILECVMGDNEGSHQIGGYVEGFSASHNCRYCTVSEAEILREPTVIREFRTPEEYDKAAAIMAEEPANSKKRHHEGVRLQAPLNQLSYFHVSNATLPACIAHDVWEGICQFDMVLLIKSFIAAGWFTLKQLNGMIANFKCKAPDSGDRPAGGFTEESSRLKGNAVQNKNFVRFFSLIIKDKIKDEKSPHWQMYLKLKQFNEMAAAPELSVEQIYYMQVVTEDYISDRKTLYPNVPLRRKHHYALHFAQFILKRGPLIQYHTLHGESKHGFFKRRARASKNYINPTANLAKHNQLNFAHVLTGPLGPELEFSKSVPLKIDTFIKPIEDVLLEMNFTENAEELKFVKIQNVQYKPSQYLILDGTGQNFSRDMYVGEIWAILHENGEIYFVVKKSLAEFNENNGLYHIRKEHDDIYVCVQLTACKDYKPYSAYNFASDDCLTLKHTFSFM